MVLVVDVTRLARIVYLVAKPCLSLSLSVTLLCMFLFFNPYAFPANMYLLFVSLSVSLSISLGLAFTLNKESLQKYCQDLNGDKRPIKPKPLNNPKYYYTSHYGRMYVHNNDLEIYT